MKRLARSFSHLVLLVIVLLAVGLFYFRPPPSLPPQPPVFGQIDRIIVEKSARRMTLLQDGKTVRTYNIALGFSPKGDKTRQGDGRTPEGLYKIDRRNDRSKFHLSLGLDYPRPEDRAKAKAAGVDPGGDIMIHGQPNSLPEAMVVKGDWTAGCIAVSNAEMREIFAAVPIGTVVDVRP